MRKKTAEVIQRAAQQHGYDKGYQDGYKDGYEIAHEDERENGYKIGCKACRMTDDKRGLFYSALDAFRDTQGVTVDEIVLEVLAYAWKAS